MGRGGRGPRQDGVELRAGDPLQQPGHSGNPDRYERFDARLRASQGPSPISQNISNGEPVLLWEVLERLCRELSLPRPRARVPRRLASLMAGALEGYHRLLKPAQEPTLTRFSVQVMSCTMTLDIGRARALLGYAPEVTVDTGLTRFVHWWREEGCRA